MTSGDGQDRVISENELRIQIISWDWDLTVAISSQMTPVEQRFQGGLSYGRFPDLKSSATTPFPKRTYGLIWPFPSLCALAWGTPKIRPAPYLRRGLST
jgi:hypothetical protein